MFWSFASNGRPWLSCLALAAVLARSGNGTSDSCSYNKSLRWVAWVLPRLRCDAKFGAARDCAIFMSHALLNFFYNKPAFQLGMCRRLTSSKVSWQSCLGSSCFGPAQKWSPADARNAKWEFYLMLQCTKRKTLGHRHTKNKLLGTGSQLLVFIDHLVLTINNSSMH